MDKYFMFSTIYPSLLLRQTDVVQGSVQYQVAIPWYNETNQSETCSRDAVKE